MKKLSIFIAVILSLTMIMTACGKKVDDSASGSAAVDATVVVTDENGEKVTDADGAIVTEKNPDGTTGTTTEYVPPKDTDTTTTAVQNFTKVRYAYSSLSAEEKGYYQTIVNAVSNFEPSVVFDKPLDQKTYFKIFGLVYFQEAQLFWMSGTYEIYDGTRQNIVLDYRCSQEDAKKMQASIDKKAAEIKAKIPAGATTVDKLKVFHDYIVLNNSFTKDGTYPQTIYGGLVEGKVQCEGYAKTLGYLCDQNGIENMLITGTNDKQASHAWNIIKVDGDWYNLDTTWDDPVGQFPADYIKYNYFLVTDKEIHNKTHFVDNQFYAPPKCDATKANYQRNYGLYAEDKDKALSLIKDEIKKAADAKNGYVQIKVSSEKILNDINNELVKNKAIYTYVDEANKTAKHKCKVTTAPVLDKNVLTIHITLNY